MPTIKEISDALQAESCLEPQATMLGFIAADGQRYIVAIFGQEKAVQALKEITERSSKTPKKPLPLERKQVVSIPKPGKGKK